MLRQVAEGVLIHESEFCQSNAVVVHGRAGVLLIDPGVLDSELAGRGWLVGDAYSAADICLYAYVHTAPEGGFDLAPHENVRRWLERVRDQPGHIPITLHG